MSNKSQTGLIGFIYKNKITLILIVILFALIKQNIIDNNFPGVVIDKERALNQIKL
jgi:cell division protein FtsB